MSSALVAAGISTRTFSETMISIGAASFVIRINDDASSFFPSRLRQYWKLPSATPCSLQNAATLFPLRFCSDNSRVHFCSFSIVASVLNINETTICTITRGYSSWARPDAYRTMESVCLQSSRDAWLHRADCFERRFPYLISDMGRWRDRVHIKYDLYGDGSYFRFRK